MAEKTERAYRVAAGLCLDAMQSLRRSDGNGAIESLKAALREIETAQRHAQQEDQTQPFPVLPRACSLRPGWTEDDDTSGLMGG